MAFSLPSFAKINWILRVLGKRDDGFHELFTLFQSVSLHDTIHFSEGEYIKLSCDDRKIWTGDTNLIVRAANALSEFAGIRAGAQIHLEKRIPSPGGLGGGSSNAAVALLGLNSLWRTGLTFDQLVKLAEGLGSDVPYFLYGGTAEGIGRGEIITAVDDVSVGEMLIVRPRISVSTRTAFSGLAASTLTSNSRESTLTVCRNAVGSFDPMRSELKNDFEASVFAKHPEIERVKRTLLECGASNAGMSGSGACVFAVFDKKETRQAAEKALDIESTWRKFVVATISRQQYREALRVS